MTTEGLLLPIAMAAASGLVGCFAVMRRMALAGDALSHVALPGIGIAIAFGLNPLLGAATMLLWTVYQHLFLLYAGRTPGMSLRSIHLRTFDGRVPQWQERGRRARFIFVSFAAAALGFLWALVDEDALCWHDRVSQTFPTTE